MKRYFFYLFFLFYTFNLFGQDNCSVFVVNVKGKAEKNINGNWSKIKNNEFLNYNDVIRIDDNSFINLFDKKEKKYFIIFGNRKLVVKDIIYSSSNNSDKQLNNIFVKVLENFANAFSKFAENRNITNLLRASNQKSEVVIISPKNSKVEGDSIIFNWVSSSQNKQFRFLLLDEELNPILDTILYDNNYLKLKNNFSFNKEYIWQLSATNSNKNVIGIFSIPDTTEIYLLKNHLDSLERTFNSLSQCDLYVLKALLCEELGFYSKAFNFYHNALVLSVDKDKYSEFLDGFFTRRKINLKSNDILTYK